MKGNGRETVWGLGQVSWSNYKFARYDESFGGFLSLSCIIGIFIYVNIYIYTYIHNIITIRIIHLSRPTLSSHFTGRFFQTPVNIQPRTSRALKDEVPRGRWKGLPRKTHSEDIITTSSFEKKKKKLLFLMLKLFKHLSFQYNFCFHSSQALVRFELESIPFLSHHKCGRRVVLQWSLHPFFNEIGVTVTLKGASCAHCTFDTGLAVRFPTSVAFNSPAVWKTMFTFTCSVHPIAFSKSDGA